VARAIELPTGDLQKSVNRVNIYRKKYQYLLEEPPLIPLRIEAKILDEPQNASTTSRFFEAHQFSDGLNIILQLTVSLPPERLRAPTSLYRDLKNILTGKRQENCILMPVADHRNREVIRKNLSALANNKGGILLFGISRPDDLGGIAEPEIPELSALVESVALPLDPPLAITAPSQFTIDDRHVLIVEVPRVIVENVVTTKSAFFLAAMPMGLTSLRLKSLP
jgi:hypothetical protein